MAMLHVDLELESTFLVPFALPLERFELGLSKMAKALATWPGPNNAREMPVGRQFVGPFKVLACNCQLVYSQA